MDQSKMVEFMLLETLRALAAIAGRYTDKMAPEDAQQVKVLIKVTKELHHDHEMEGDRKASEIQRGGMRESLREGGNVTSIRCGGKTTSISVGDRSHHSGSRRIEV